MQIESQRAIVLRKEGDVVQCGCGGKVVTAFSVSGEREMVCSRCGIVVPSVGAESGSMIYGRAPLSLLVDGDNLGTNHTSRDSNGKNFLYEARGPKSNVFPDGATIMPGHIPNLEERDRDLSNMKHNISDALKKAGAKPIRMEYAARIFLSVRKKCLSKRKPTRRAWYNDEINMLNHLGTTRKVDEMYKQIEQSILDAKMGKAPRIV